MLQHETVLETPSLPLLPRQAEAPSPQELAQAVVAIEDRRATSAAGETRALSDAQTLAACGLDITPEELRAEVREQRVRMAREAAMTRRQLGDSTFWLLVGGAALSTIAALILLFASYTFAVRLRATDAALAAAQAQNSAQPPAVNASQVVNEWLYPQARSKGMGDSARLASRKLTTSDSYASVWKFYAQKIRFSAATSGRDLKFNKEGIVPDYAGIGGGQENGQDYSTQIDSSSASPDRMATFVKQNAHGTLTATITYDPVHKATNIRLSATQR